MKPGGVFLGDDGSLSEENDFENQTPSDMGLDSSDLDSNSDDEEDVSYLRELRVFKPLFRRNG